MRSLALIFLLALALPTSAAWLTDLDAARKQAAEEKKDIHLVFTALKFSGACVQLEKRVLSQESFQEAAGKMFILVHLDVPLEQTPGTISPLAANRITSKKYRVESYPTAFLLDPEARAYSSETGAIIGDPQQYLARLAGKLEARNKRSRDLEIAYQKDGIDRAKAIIAVLKTVPREADPALYQMHMTELAKVDPDDSLGFQKKRLAEQGFRDLNQALEEVFHKDSYDQVVKLVDDYVKKFEPIGTLRQKALFPKLAALNHGGQVPEAIVAADEIIAIDPDSSHGKLAAQFRKNLKAR